MHRADGSPAAERAKGFWVKVALIFLVIEKIIQHTFATLAFYFNRISFPHPSLDRFYSFFE